MNRFLLLLILFAGSAQALQSEKGTFDDELRNRSIPYEIWLPVSDNKVPLVVLSHGSEGQYQNHNWLISELVKNQYAVLGLNHPNNTSRDRTEEGVVRVWDRPTDISRLLDHILANHSWSARIDSDRIGVTGFSSGGHTALALAGAIYSAGQINAYCSSELRGADCDLVSKEAYAKVDFAGASESYRDQRIKAAFAMAPAVGAAIKKRSLEAIDIPVFITAADDDELLNPTLNARYYAANIPNSELKMIPSGGHFVFLECSLVTRVADWFIENLDLCGDAFDVDREEVWPALSSMATTFFDKNLKQVAPNEALQRTNR